MKKYCEDVLWEYHCRFVRTKDDMMSKIGNALEAITEELVSASEEMSDGERSELEKLQDKLEAVYEGLEGLANY